MKARAAISRPRELSACSKKEGGGKKGAGLDVRTSVGHVFGGTATDFRHARLAGTAAEALEAGSYVLCLPL